MKKYRYVIVCCNGASWDTRRQGAFGSYGLGGSMTYDLPALLDKGWRPVRETPFGGMGDHPAAFALVLLEKGTDDEAEAEVEPA